MDNFFTDLAQFQWPHLYKEHILLTTVSPGVEWALVDPLSIAEYVESAFTNPENFQQEEIGPCFRPFHTGSDIFGDELVVQVSKSRTSLYQREAASRGIFPMVLEWVEVISKDLETQVDMQALEKYPVKLLSFPSI